MGRLVYLTTYWKSLFKLAFPKTKYRKYTKIEYLNLSRTNLIAVVLNFIFNKLFKIFPLLFSYQTYEPNVNCIELQIKQIEKSKNIKVIH